MSTPPPTSILTGRSVHDLYIFQARRFKYIRETRRRALDLYKRFNGTETAQAQCLGVLGTELLHMERYREAAESFVAAARTLWMKNSEIAHYWMARELSELSMEEDGRRQTCTIEVGTKFPTDNFTLAIRNWAARRMQINVTDLPLYIQKKP